VTIASLHADHFIENESEFRRLLDHGYAAAEADDVLVTIGIRPTEPNTGYGYLEIGNEIARGVAEVRRFVEKPDLIRAEEFVRAGNYDWNGGMFVWRADVILRAFDELMPEMRQAWEAAHGKVGDAYPKMTATSIDYGVMEKAKNVVTFSLDAGWDDLGSWTSLESLADVLRARHETGVVTGGDIVTVESSGNIVDAPGKLVALLGVKDLIVVHQGDSILVARKDRAQDIKLVVDRVKAGFPDKA
jgi:mannose-1-phosphate guanylyltransferase